MTILSVGRNAFKMVEEIRRQFRDIPGLLEGKAFPDSDLCVDIATRGALPWLFSSLSIRAVSRAAAMIVEEVRRQFRIPGIMEGTTKPDYARVVGISTGAAQKELVPLATISVLMPLLVGIVLGVEALGGFLAGSIVTGIIFALFMANSGGLWDNAKKYIEDGAYGGSGSEAHKAAVVGDTVGDPFKDTAGPSLNTLITVMSLVATVFGPLIASIALFGL